MASQEGAQASPTQAALKLASKPSLKDRLPKLEPRKRSSQPSNPTPVPETPALPDQPDLSNWHFKVPTRRILTKQDHETFASSYTHKLIVAWVFGLAESVVDVPCSAVREGETSDAVKTLLGILDEAEKLTGLSPPDEQGGSRFGNKAFRGFLDLARDRSVKWHKELGLENDDAIAEASTYLKQGFGNGNRIDYGSGHELNFMIWLLCLYQLRVLQREDFKAIVLKVFTRYLRVMRTVQMLYYLEPAGSHGVWGLDDYQFLPFLFGATQLLHHPYITALSTRT